MKERTKELIVERGSARLNYFASSTSSAALRAQTRGKAAAAIRKEELQMKRNQIESQLALQIQEQELAAIEDELGISDPPGFDLPKERVDQRVNNYLENLCELSPDNIGLAIEQPSLNTNQVGGQSNQIATQHPTVPPSQPQHPTVPRSQPQHPTVPPSQHQCPTFQPPQPQYLNSQRLDPTTSAFNLYTQTSSPPEPHQDTMRSYIDFMACRDLIASKIEKFDDQPRNYHIWKECSRI